MAKKYRKDPTSSVAASPAPPAQGSIGQWLGVSDAVRWYRATYQVSQRTAENQLYTMHRKEPGFPSRKTKGPRGVILFDMSRLPAWFAAYKHKCQMNNANRGNKLLLPSTPALTPSMEPGAAPNTTTNAAIVLDPNELAYINTLADPNASPVDKGRATYNLATLRLSRMAREGAISGAMLSEISKSLQELRRSEEGYMQIEERRGDLVPLPLCQEIVGELVRRLNDVCSKLSSLLGTEIEVWMTSNASSTERRRTIRAWLQHQMHELRTLEGKSVAEVTAAVMARVELRHEEMKGKQQQ